MPSKPESRPTHLIAPTVSGGGMMVMAPAKGEAPATRDDAETDEPVNENDHPPPVEEERA